MANVIELLTQYNEAENKLHEYFGFTPQWRVIPLADKTEAYWFLDTHKVVYSDAPFTKELIEQEQYCASEFYPRMMKDDSVKYLLRKDGYTMVIVDTETDFNVFLMIFDNTKELKNKELITVYHRVDAEYEDV